MANEQQFREPIRDGKALSLALAKLKGNLTEEYSAPVDKEFVRAFLRFKNSDVPAVLQPLLKLFVRWTHTFIAEPRDTIFVSRIILGCLTVVPSALWLLYRFNWIHAILHTWLLWVNIPAFNSMLHCVSHRILSKSALPLVDIIIHYLMAPFYGQTWNTFYYFHVKHHHVEENGPLDLSSTIWYDRDNWFHFLIYFVRFHFFIGLELPLYFLKKGQLQWALYTFIGEYSTLTLYAFSVFACANPLSIIFVWFLPFIFARFEMMINSWTRYAFLDQDDAQNPYRSTLTLMQTRSNALCFNDGYHTSHYLNPVRHWQDHPEHFVQSAEEFRDQKAIVFSGFNHLQLWWALMTRNYQRMADHLEDFSEQVGNDQKAQLLKTRLRRFTPYMVINQTATY